MIYLVTVFDVRSTQENPIKPRVIAVNSLQLDAFLSKNVTPDTYCMVSHVDSDCDDDFKASPII